MWFTPHDLVEIEGHLDLTESLLRSRSSPRMAHLAPDRAGVARLRAPLLLSFHPFLCFRSIFALRGGMARAPLTSVDLTSPC